MHDDRSCLQSLCCPTREDKGVLQALVLGRGREALSLYASDIEDVGPCDSILQQVGFFHLHPCRSQGCDIAGRQAQGGRGDQHHLLIRVHGQEWQ